MRFEVKIALTLMIGIYGSSLTGCGATRGAAAKPTPQNTTSNGFSNTPAGGTVNQGNGSSQDLVTQVNQVIGTTWAGTINHAGKDIISYQAVFSTVDIQGSKYLNISLTGNSLQGPFTLNAPMGMFRETSGNTPMLRFATSSGVVSQLSAAPISVELYFIDINHMSLYIVNSSTDPTLMSQFITFYKYQ